MFRRLFSFVLALAAALLACTAAFAEGPAAGPVLAQSSNFHALPCLGAGTGFAGLMTTTFTVKSAGGHGYVTLSGNVRAGLLFTYQPNDPAQASYVGVQIVNQTISVPATSPATTASVDFPVTVPVIGSDGSVSQVTTTATATFTPDRGHTYDGDLTIGGEFGCVADALRPAVAPIPAAASAALVNLVDAASQAGAAGAVASSLAQNTSSRAFATFNAMLTSPNGVQLVDSMLASPFAVAQLNGLATFFGQLNAAAAAAAN